MRTSVATGDKTPQAGSGIDGIVHSAKLDNNIPATAEVRNKLVLAGLRLASIRAPRQAGILAKLKRSTASRVVGFIQQLGHLDLQRIYPDLLGQGHSAPPIR